MDPRQDQVLVVPSGERTTGPPTPGMDRQQAFATEGILTGSLRMGSGLGGSNTVDAAPGDVVYVPKGAVHRESNPSASPADIIVVRAGRGESTFNVDGPQI